jgi:hypothetical protein
MSRLLLFVFCCISFSAIGQDLTGIWRGHFRSSSNRILEQLLGEEDRYKFEIQLDQRNKEFNGVTYSYKTTVFYGKATCSGAVNTKNSKVILEELKIVELRMVGGFACIMTLFLQYSKSGAEEFLEGTYTSINTTDSSNCGRGTVFLRKVTTSDFHKEPFLVAREKEKAALRKSPPVAKTTRPPATSSTTTNPVKKTTAPTTTAKAPVIAKTTKPVTSPPATNKNTAVKKSPPANTSTTKKPVTKTTPIVRDTARNNKTVKVAAVDTSKKVERRPITVPKVLLTRENELVKTITTDANEITINLYDNGTIDNDTVSVYLNKKLAVAKQRLTEKPISIKFVLDENNLYHELVMVAENLGEIPPNTSLMVVKAGSKQYEVRITSTEQKNAVVIFKYEKQQ